MLYDNALLLRAYAHGPDVPEIRWPAVAAETADFCSTRWPTAPCSCRRWTPTRGPRGLDLRLDADAADRGAGPTTAAWPPRFSLSPAGTFDTAARFCSCPPTRLCRNGWIGFAPRRRPPGATATQPDVTTRSSRRGTGWRSPRWPRPVWPWRPELARAARRCASAAGSCTWSTAGCGGPASAESSATAPRSSRTTRAGHRAAGAPPAGRRSVLADRGDRAAGHRAARISPTRSCPAAGTTPPTTPSADAAAGRPAGRGDPVGASPITEALLTAAHLVDSEGAATCRRRTSLNAHSVLLARAPRSAGHWLAVAEAAVADRCRSRSPVIRRGLAAARRRAPVRAGRGDRGRR